MAFKFNALSGQFDIDTNAGAGVYAPVDATYVVASLNGTLTAEQVLTGGAGITVTPNAGAGTITVAMTTPLQESQTRHYVMALMGA